ncbi:PREDICTED: uncharacterized protein C10orf95-like [Chinchilla lanigera]|uniref:uncharacterized protein C10orf95-like n=1 Tax=Chinchilla lanigera TaxID=34839 RepID=UPI00038EA5E2|nr:PREDICTED: uncharacterized protein C10orf95-like [Chinchilla lanigera]
MHECGGPLQSGGQGFSRSQAQPGLSQLGQSGSEAAASPDTEDPVPLVCQLRRSGPGASRQRCRRLGGWALQGGSGEARFHVLLGRRPGPFPRFPRRPEVSGAALRATRERSRRREAGAGRTVEISASPSPVQMAAGPAAVRRRPEAQGSLRAAPGGRRGSRAPRETRGCANPQWPDPRGPGLWGARSAPSPLGPGSHERARWAQRCQQPESRAGEQSCSPRLECARRGTGCRPPPPQSAQAVSSVPPALLAAQARGPSWGEGSGAHRGDPRGDPDSRHLGRAALPARNRPRRPLGPLVRRSLGARTLRGRI